MGYPVNQIIGKTMYARTQVPYKLLPWDDAPIAGYMQKGQSIGVVYSYLGVKANRSNIYWMFYNAEGQAYYVEHIGAYFDLNQLRAQGAQTSEEIEQAAADEAGGIFSKPIRQLTSAAAGGIILYAILRGLNS